MARVTVEDCLEHVDNRFELVMVASRRVRQMERFGADPLVERENDKPTVIALREIAAGLINDDVLAAADARANEIQEIEIPIGVRDEHFDDF